MDNNTVLLVVDVQNDFCPGGSLAVAEGDMVVAPLNALIRQMVHNQQHGDNLLVVATRDWHPAQCEHFAQWPVHCVANTPGAEFHPALDLNGVHILSKGTDRIGDAYSPFEGTMDETGESLDQFLKRHQITTVLVGGLALDYCVKAAAIDAANLGYQTTLLLDAVRLVNPSSFNQTLELVSKAGVQYCGSGYALNVFTLGQSATDHNTEEYDGSFT